jgi:Glycosyl hydrolase family 79 C-terminal beta domain
MCGWSALTSTAVGSRTSPIPSAFPRVHVATVHRYPLLRCATRLVSPIYPSIPNLLAARSTTGLAASVAPLAAIAHAHRVSFASTSSTVSRPGQTRRQRHLRFRAVGARHPLRAGPRRRRWDQHPYLRERGLRPIHVHSLCGPPVGHVKPIHHGLLMFARAAPPGSRLLATAHPPEPTLRTWATLAPSRTIRVVLINDSPDRPATLAIRTPADATPTASLTRLLAPGLAATTDVTLAGQTFGTRTTTANPTGDFTVAAVEPIKRRYVITLPAASAALLTVPERRPDGRRTILASCPFRLKPAPSSTLQPRDEQDSCASNVASRGDRGGMPSARGPTCAGSTPGRGLRIRAAARVIARRSLRALDTRRHARSGTRAARRDDGARTRAPGRQRRNRPGLVRLLGERRV